MTPSVTLGTGYLSPPNLMGFWFPPVWLVLLGARSVRQLASASVFRDILALSKTLLPRGKQESVLRHNFFRDNLVLTSRTDSLRFIRVMYPWDNLVFASLNKTRGQTAFEQVQGMHLASLE